MGYCYISSIRYSSLKEDYNELLFEKSKTIDSLELDNKKKIESICNLEFEIEVLYHELDSLYGVKNQIVENKIEYTISSSITESSTILKKHLNETIIDYSF